MIPEGNPLDKESSGKIIADTSRWCAASDGIPIAKRLFGGWFSDPGK